MAAPNLETLFNLEPAVEKAFRARFAARFATLPAYIQREDRDITGQQLGIQFTTGDATDRIHGPLADGSFRPDSFSCTLQLKIQTVRIKGRPDCHGYFRGRVRALVMEARHDDAFLPYYVLNPFDPQLGGESIQYEDGCDLSSLVFTGIIGIRPSAWPA